MKSIMQESRMYDVIVVGGSYAGLSAAMSLGRSLKKVLVIDSGLPCNRQTPHSHNFLTQDGVAPAAIAAVAREQVLQYTTVTMIEDTIIAGRKTNSGFLIETQSETIFEGKKLIFATGIKDQLPPIEGFSDCWGITAIHCPYCHGYEFRNKKTGILANGDRAFHLASLVHNLTKNITLLTAGNPDFTPEQSATLNKHGIRIIPDEIAAIIHEEGIIKRVAFKNNHTLAIDALYAAVPFTQNTNVPVQLGCELTESGHLKVDSFQKTTVAGVFACGDNAAMMRSVANAVASGNLAGAMANAALTKEQF